MALALPVPLPRALVTAALLGVATFAVSACTKIEGEPVATHAESEQPVDSSDRVDSDAACVMLTTQSTGPTTQSTEPDARTDAGQEGDAATRAVQEAGRSPSTEVDSAVLPPWRLTCGNGAIDPGEVCDDGNVMDGDSCSAMCCINPNFLCDPGWNSTHTAPCHCGDGSLEPNEECDDGNRRFGDGCSGHCELESGACGNGELDEGETCDDGNLVARDGCDPGCYTEFNCIAHPIPANPDAGKVSEGDAGLR